MVLITAVGCGVEARLVSPLDRQEILRGQALTVLLSRVEPNPTPVEPADDSPTECLCGGTGRSGDGLGPCACTDGCKCKTKGAELTPLETTVAETGDHELRWQLDELTTRVTGHEDRLKALEARLTAGTVDSASDATGFTEEQATSKRPSVQVVCVSRLGCGPCVQQHKRFEQLTAVGWKIGDESDSHIIKVMNTDVSESRMIQRAQQVAARSGYPTLCFFRDGEFQSAVVGLMEGHAIADRVNALVNGRARTQRSPSDYDSDIQGTSLQQQSGSPCPTNTLPRIQMRHRSEGVLRGLRMILIRDNSKRGVPDTRRAVC